jgi:hypothetical protein
MYEPELSNNDYKEVILFSKIPGDPKAQFGASTYESST